VGGKTKHKKLYGYGGNMSKLPTGRGIGGPSFGIVGRKDSSVSLQSYKVI